MKFCKIVPVITLLAAFARPVTGQAQNITPAETRAIAEAAYIYGYSLMTTEVTQESLSFVCRGWFLAAAANGMLWRMSI